MTLLAVSTLGWGWWAGGRAEGHGSAQRTDLPAASGHGRATCPARLPAGWSPPTPRPKPLPRRPPGAAWGWEPSQHPALGWPGSHPHLHLTCLRLGPITGELYSVTRCHQILEPQGVAWGLEWPGPGPPPAWGPTGLSRWGRSPCGDTGACGASLLPPPSRGHLGARAQTVGRSVSRSVGGWGVTASVTAPGA